MHITRLHIACLAGVILSWLAPAHVRAQYTGGSGLGGAQAVSTPSGSCSIPLFTGGSFYVGGASGNQDVARQLPNGTCVLPVFVGGNLYTGGASSILDRSQTIQNPNCAIPIFVNSPIYAGGSSSDDDRAQAIQNPNCLIPTYVQGTFYVGGQHSGGGQALDTASVSCAIPVFVGSPIYTGGDHTGGANGAALQNLNCALPAPVTSNIYTGGTGTAQDRATQLIPCVPPALFTTIQQGDSLQTCQGIPVNLNATTTNGTTPYTFNWSGNGAAFLTATNIQNPQFSAATAGLYQLIITVTDAVSATDRDTITIRVTPSVSAPQTPTGLTTICQGTGSSSYTTSAIGATTYSWSISPLSAGSISGTSTIGTVNWNSAFTGVATISVTATNSCGTSSATTLAVTVNPLPTSPTVLGPTTACQGTASLTFSGSGGGGSSYVYNISNNAAGSISASGVLTLQPTFSGTFDVLVQSQNACGQSAGAVYPVTIQPLPGIPNAPTGTTSLCQGSASFNYSTLAANASTFNWSISPSNAGSITGTGSTATFTQNPSFSGTFDVVVSATNSCGTSSTAQTTVNVGIAPVLPTQPSGPTTACAGGVSLFSTSAPGASTLNWSILPANAGTIQGTGSSVNITWSAGFSGAAQVLVSSTNGCGTSANASATITIQPLPSVPQYVSGSSSLCQGFAGDQYIFTSTDAVSYQYSISNPAAGTIDNVGNFILNPTFSGSFNVIVDASNICGTSAASSFPVTISPLPGTPSIPVGPTQLCAGASGITYTASASNATSLSWSLNPANAGTINTSGQLTLNGAFNGTLQISVVALNNCGVSSAQNLSVVVSGAPSLPTTPQGASFVCPGSTQTYTSTAAGASSYTWSLNPTSAGSISGTGNTATVVWAPGFSGNALVLVSPVSACGTGSASSLLVSALSVPNAPSPISGTFTICQGSTGSSTFQTSSNNATAYSWSITPSQAGSISGTDSNGIVNWNQNFSGTATIQVIAQNSCGNSTATTQAIQITPGPSLQGTINGPLQVCSGPNSNTYSVSATNATGYLWSIQPANAAVLVNPTSPAVTVNWDPSYSGTATLSVFISNSCQSIIANSGTITVNALPANASTPAGPTNNCAGSSTTFTTTATGANTFNWQLIPSNAGTISGNASSQTIQWNSSFAGSAQLTVTASNACGASTPASINVTILAAPTPPSAIIGAINVCGGITETYSTSGPADLNYQWNLVPTSAGTISGNGTNATVVWSNLFSGNAQIQVTSQNACGTSAATVINTQVTAPPIAGFTWIVNGLSAQFTDASSGATSYQWSFGDNGTSSTSNPTHTYAGAGTYFVTQTVSNICGSAQFTDTVVISNTAVDGGWSDKQLQVYPNPFAQFITIERPQADVTFIALYSLNGQLIQSWDDLASQTHITIDVANAQLANGVYVLRIQTANQWHQFRLVRLVQP